MKVTKNQAVSLLEALGLDDVGSMDTATIQDKLNDLGSFSDDALEKVRSEEDDNSTLLEEIASLDEGETVTVRDKTDKDKPSKAKGSKKDAATKDKPVKKPKKESAEKDRFGMRLGTRAAEINKVIGKKAKTLKEIVEEAGVKPPIHSHMKKLQEKGYVVEKDGKWAQKK